MTMEWHQLTEDDLRADLVAVKSELGYAPEAARRLIQYFYHRIHDGADFPEHLLFEFLEHAFGRMLNNPKVSADQAFGLKLQRGKYQREDTTVRDVVAVASVIRDMRRGKLWTDAKGEAANLFFPDGRGDKAVEEAYSKSHRWMEALSDTDLDEILQAGPLISNDKIG